MENLAYTVDEACRAARIGRTRLYEEIGAGRLVVSRVGRKTLIPAHRLREWLDSCERPPAPIDHALAGRRPRAGA